MSSDITKLFSVLNSPDMLDVIENNRRLEEKWENSFFSTPNTKKSYNRFVEKPTPEEPAKMKRARSNEAIPPFDESWLSDLTPIINYSENDIHCVDAIEPYILSEAIAEDVSKKQSEIRPSSLSCRENVPPTKKQKSEPHFDANYPYAKLASTHGLSFWPVRSLKDANHRFLKSFLSRTSNRKEACQILGCSSASLSKKIKVKYHNHKSPGLCR